MLPLIFLKVLGDLGFFYSFAGFFAVKFGADANMLLITLAVQSVCVLLSFTLENKGWIRFVPIGLSLLTFLLPGFCLAYALCAATGMIYMVMMAKDKTYYPGWAVAADTISLYCKIAAIFTIIMTVMKGFDALSAITFPCALITMCSCIMLTRSMRHDIDVYTSPVYQLMNGGTALALGLGTLIISSEGFRKNAGSLIKTVYLAVIAPLLVFVTQVYSYILFAIAKLFGWILKLLHVEGAEVPDYETIYGESTDDYIRTDFDPNAHPILKTMARIALILFAVYLAYRLFRKMQGMQTRVKPDETGETQTRSFIGRADPKTRSESEGMAEKLREQYRRYLKLYLKHNLPLEKSFTSESILNASQNAFDEEPNTELRSLYIRARYAGRADKDDVARAKELVRIMKKDKEV